MPIDNSIYFQQQAPDIMGGIQQGLKMRDMIDQRAMQREALEKEKRINDAYAAGIETAPDGSVSMNPKTTLAKLAGADPREAMRFQVAEQERAAAADKARMEKNLKEADLVSRVAGSAVDQATYDQGVAFLAKSGVDVSSLPKQFDPNLVRSYQRRALSYKEQAELALRERELAIKERESRVSGSGGGGGGGKAPQGYRFKADGSGSLEPIPGGPAALAKDKGEQARKTGASLVVQDIGRSLDLIDKSPGAAGTKDFGLMSYVPGSSAQQLDSLLDSVKSNIGFDKLQAMREASPTGGALGSVSEKETAMLQATAGKLSSYMPEDQLKDNLKRLANQYNDIVHGPGKGPARHKLSFDENGNPVEQRLVKQGSGQEQKVVDGVTYRKVEGGWEEIPMPAAR